MGIHVTLLWLLTALFLARLLGQLLVVADLAPFLPPADAWMSGLVPYPVLLTAQFAILAVQCRWNLDAGRAGGPRRRFRPRTVRIIYAFATVYAVAMAVRAFVTTGGAIPITFHFVLATYLFVLAHAHART